MDQKNIKKGFVTIATGHEKYYKLAQNLLHSYRLHCNDSIPFAIICDKKRPETEEFDHVILLNKPNHSFLDKLQLFDTTPYEETIFVDSDSLFLSDPSSLWEDFNSADDFSCYGKSLPLDARNGWFFYDQTDEFKPYINFIVKMHGGLYYLRNSNQCKEIFERALYIVDNFHKFRFAHFDKPADEPVLALSMAVSNCHPYNESNRITFAPSYEGRLRVTHQGLLQLDKKPHNTIILHFGTSNTQRFIYRYLQYLVELRYHNHDNVPNRSFFYKLRLQCLPLDIKIPLVRKIKHFIKYSVSPKNRDRIRRILGK